MKRLSIFAAALVLSALAQSASAGLLNNEVKAVYHYPNASSQYATLGQGVVDADGLEFGFDDGGPLFTMRIEDNRITIDYVSENGWNSAAFNGFSLANLSGALPQFVIGAGTNLAGFGASNLSVVDDILYVNWQGLSFDANTMVVLDVVGGQSDVPEPLSLALFGVGLAGLAAGRRARK